MTSRQWRGVAKAERAPDYVEHRRTETLPQRSGLRRFVSASIVERPVENGVEFVIVTTWDSADAIVAFAGADIDRAVVPPVVQQMMIEYDRTVRHYEVV